MKLTFVIIFLSVFMSGCEKYSYDGYFENEIIGKWEWVESCGGFTGGCWYPTADHKEQVEFTSNQRYIRTVNGIKTVDQSYTLGDSYERGNIKYFKISFNNEWNTVYWFLDKDTFEIPGGDFVEKFKRIK
jgi:hypothetical protein